MAIGQVLRRQSITSANDVFTLVHQDDGDLVLYENVTGSVLWSAQTRVGWRRDPGRVALQLDGNLVVLDGDGRPAWSTGLDDPDIARLVVRDDGDVVLERVDGSVCWSLGTAVALPIGAPRAARGDRLRCGQSLRHQSLTSSNGRFVFAHQVDGNLVIYDYDGRANWADGTFGAGSRMVLEDDGSLVVRLQDGGSLDLIDGGVREVILLDNGHLVALDGPGNLIWSSTWYTESDWRAASGGSPTPAIVRLGAPSIWSAYLATAALPIQVSARRSESVGDVRQGVPLPLPVP